MSAAKDNGVLSIRYIPLAQAKPWDRNPKAHDLSLLIRSIQEHGFRDAPIFDETLGAIVAGNGRIEALTRMHDTGLEAPLGVRVTKKGEWEVPIQFGISSDSVAQAEAFGVDHNNLVFGKLTDRDRKVIEKAWNPRALRALAEELTTAGHQPLSVDIGVFGRLKDLGVDPDEALINKDEEDEPDVYGGEQWEAAMRPDEIYVLRNDAVFRSENEFGIPDLREDRLADVDVLPHQVFPGYPFKLNSGKGTMAVWGSFKQDNQMLNGAVLGFYIEDEHFLEAWDDATSYVEKLRRIKWGAVVAPDFSTWGYDPLVLRLFSIYRSRWCGRFWQEAGFNVIPSIQWWGGDRKSLSLAALGIPKGAPVLSMQVRTTAKEVHRKEMIDEILPFIAEEMKPKACILYGGLDNEAWLKPHLPSGVEWALLYSYASTRRAARKAIGKAEKA